MPYVTNDGSKAVQRIAEIERQLQEAKAEFERWLAKGIAPTSAAELAQREREGKGLTDRLQVLATALELQRALASPALHAQERALAKASLKKMKDFGYRSVTVQFLGGMEVEVMVRYWCRSQPRADKGKGSYFGLTLLGVCDRTTPALASEVAQLAAALSSFEDAQARLRQMGVDMSIRRIANVAYHFAQRARSRQAVDGMGIEGSLAGRRVVISTDGGRLRVRKNKRGKRTKKWRSRYRTDWREPKLLVIYAVDETGRIAQEFAPVIDGTLQAARRSVSADGILSPPVAHRPSERSLVHCRRGEVDLVASRTIVEASGIGGRRALPGVGGFLPRRRARLCPGRLEHVVAGPRAEALGDATTASLVAWRTEGVHRRSRATLRGEAWQGLESRTGLPPAQRSCRASGLCQGASREDADGQRLDGERGPSGHQLAVEGARHLLARGARRTDAHVACLLQVETLASP